MKGRRILAAELPALLRLYTFLHAEDPVMLPDDPAVRSHWTQILANENLPYYVVEEEKQIVSTCALTLIPNLTRGLRPYGLIENVVTDPSFRRKGCGTEVLRCALENAWRAACYKVLLETGSKREETLNFDERAGFKRGVKTGQSRTPRETTVSRGREPIPRMAECFRGTCLSR